MRNCIPLTFLWLQEPLTMISFKTDAVSWKAGRTLEGISILSPGRETLFILTKQLNLSKVLTTLLFRLGYSRLCLLLMSLSCWGLGVVMRWYFSCHRTSFSDGGRWCSHQGLFRFSAYLVCCLRNKCTVVPAPGASIFCIMVTQSFSLIFVGLNHGSGDHHIKLTSTATARYIILQVRFWKFLARWNTYSQTLEVGL